MRNEKRVAVEDALKQIEKQFGKGSIMILGDEYDTQIDSIPTGSIALDNALGIGGYPKGRIIEIYGHESSGKTTLTLHAMAETQKAGGLVAFIDAEHSLDPIYAKNLGVDLDNLVLSQPDTGEQALEIAEALIRSNAIDLLVVDSVAALVPEAEINGEMGDAHIGLQARMMSKAMRKLSGIVNKTKTVVIFINQVREKVGIVYGSPEVTTGGRALKYFASVRLEIRRSELLKQGTQMIGIRCNVKVVKSKVSSPLKVIPVDIMYGTGISHAGEVLDLAADAGIVKKSGAWYSYNDEKIGQGRENAKVFLDENLEILAKIEDQLRQNQANK